MKIMIQKGTFLLWFYFPFFIDAKLPQFLLCLLDNLQNLQTNNSLGSINKNFYKLTEDRDEG